MFPQIPVRFINAQLTIFFNGKLHYYKATSNLQIGVTYVEADFLPESLFVF